MLLVGGGKELTKVKRTEMGVGGVGNGSGDVGFSGSTIRACSVGVKSTSFTMIFRDV
jgi:hypothetical protein